MRTKITNIVHHNKPAQQVLRADPDSDIVARLADGDAHALAPLMERHLRQIKSLAWHLLGDEMEAEDIAQEVFIKAWQHAPVWQSGQAKFSTWMHRVCKNLCYDKMRKKKPLYLDVMPDAPDGAASALNTMITTETSAQKTRHMRTALEQLAPRQLTAITLHHFEQKSQQDAAQIMGINVRAYESLLARGRKKLRSLLTTKRTS